jgi:hypothetical protein
VYPKPIETLYGTRELWHSNARGTEAEPNLNLYDLRPAINGHDPLHLTTVRDVICHRWEGDAFRRRIEQVEVTAYSFHGLGFLKRSFWLARQYVEGPVVNWETPFPPTTTVFLDDTPTLNVHRIERSALRKSPVSEQSSEQSIVSALDSPTVFSGSPEAPPKSVSWSSQTPLDGRHAAVALAFSADAPVEVRVLFVNRETGAQEFGRFIRLDAVPNRTYRYELPAPDYPMLEIGVLPMFTERAGTFALRELTLRTDEADEGDRIRIVSRTVNSVEVELRELPEYRILTFVDSDYQGWRATVDGTEAPILRANSVFKAVEVAPGTHRVRFEFRPMRVYVGLGLMGTAVVGSIAGFGYLGISTRKRRREGDVHE